MADRTNKATGIKVISTVGRDPEAGRFKRVKEEEERLRMVNILVIYNTNIKIWTIF